MPKQANFRRAHLLSAVDNQAALGVRELAVGLLLDKADQGGLAVLLPLLVLWWVFLPWVHWVFVRCLFLVSVSKQETPFRKCGQGPVAKRFPEQTRLTVTVDSKKNTRGYLKSLSRAPHNHHSPATNRAWIEGGAKTYQATEAHMRQILEPLKVRHGDTAGVQQQIRDDHHTLLNQVQVRP